MLASCISFAHAFALHSWLHVCLCLCPCTAVSTHRPRSTLVMFTIALPLSTICSVLGLRTRQSTHACLQSLYFGQFVVWLLISFYSFAGLYYKLELKCTLVFSRQLIRIMKLHEDLRRPASHCDISRV